MERSHKTIKKMKSFTIVITSLGAVGTVAIHTVSIMVPKRSFQITVSTCRHGWNFVAMSAMCIRSTIPVLYYFVASL